ncbi:MAG: DUF1127 domain-containing protein [Paracoccaceae bacterium]
MPTTTHSTVLPPRARTEPFTLIGLIRYIDATYIQRQRLKNLDNAALQDIGLTRLQVAREISRPIWDVPQYWRR